MSKEVEFIPSVLQVACLNGQVHAHYMLKLKTPFFEGVVGEGDIELASPEIEEKVRELTALVVQQLRDRIGDSSDENPLGSDLPVSHEDEDPL